MAKGAIAPHRLIQKNVDGTYTLYGYVGATSADGFLTFYSDVTDLDQYLRIPVAAIRHYEDAPDDMLPFDGTVLFVDGDAEITYCYKLTLDTAAEAMLSGPIVKEYLSKARDTLAEGGAMDATPIVAAITPGNQCPPNVVRCLITYAYACDPT